MRNSTYCLIIAAFGAIFTMDMSERAVVRASVPIFLAAFYVCRAIEKKEGTHGD